VNFLTFQKPGRCVQTFKQQHLLLESSCKRLHYLYLLLSIKGTAENARKCQPRMSPAQEKKGPGEKIKLVFFAHFFKVLVKTS
jgi:hypothetical protein